MWRCNQCNGTNIENKVWADPNDDTVLDSLWEEDFEHQWCRDCEAHVEFIDIQE